MNDRRAAVVSLIWLAAAALFVVALIAGAVVVIGDPTAENAFRWIMALLFIGTPMVSLWRRDRATVVDFFKR